MSRLFSLPVLLLALVVTAASAFAGVPLVTSYQGRLLGSDDQPVSGSFTMFFQIYETPTGGVPLWTEDHVGIQVTDGLFTVALGSTVPLSSDLLAGGGGGGGGVTRYLQIQVAGQPPILPRTPLAAAPYAVTTGSVSGDIQTAPNQLGIGDLDGDGIPDIVVARDVSSARLSINTKGTGAKRVGTGRDSDGDGVRDYLDCDDDGDGVMESSSTQLVNSDSVHFSQKIKIDNTPARISTNFTVSKQSQGVDFGQRYDQDGDGVAETEMSSTVERKSGSIIYLDREGNEVLRAQVGVDSTRGILTTDRDSDGDGVPEDEAYMRVEPGRAYHAIKTKGTGAESNRVISSTDSSKAETVHAADLDGDGDPEQAISLTVLPTTSSVAIKTKGTGADKDRVISSTTDTSKAVTVHSADTDGDGLADRVIREQCDDDDASITVARGSGEIKIKHKGWDGTIKGRMAIEQGGAIQVDFAGDGVGFVSQRFGVGVLSPTNPIEHSSGAHLTAGGVWTNASDANLKENFQPVDGAELLNRLEQLPISEWNYRTESDEIRHIGPTAQDFQKVFGVGENDKTISTIDPAGIALAAAKELRLELKDKTQQISDLHNKVAQLQALVEKLLAEKK